MGKYQNKREGHTKSVISRTPCTDLGRGQHKGRTSTVHHKQEQRGYQRKPPNPWSYTKGHSASNGCCMETADLLTLSDIYTQGTLCSRYRTQMDAHFQLATYKVFADSYISFF